MNLESSLGLRFPFRIRRSAGVLLAVLAATLTMLMTLVQSANPQLPGGAQSDDLIDAAFKGDLARVNALLDTKLDLNARKGNQPNGATALMGASQNGHLEVVRALLDAKVDVNAKLDNGFTALILASQYDHAEVVRELLNAKADVNARGPRGTEALIWAS